MCHWLLVILDSRIGNNLCKLLDFLKQQNNILFQINNICTWSSDMVVILEVTKKEDERDMCANMVHLHVICMIMLDYL